MSLMQFIKIESTAHGCVGMVHNKWVNTCSTMPRIMWGPSMACSWKVGPFWGLTNLLFILGTIMVAWDTTIGSTICF
jgi:hypothetical protein